MQRREQVLATILIAALTYPAARLWGQAVYGGIVGTITDSSGAGVPNAKVAVTACGWKPAASRLTSRKT